MNKTHTGLSPLPEFFRPILWSYRFDDMDAEEDRDTIIVQTVNYGHLAHWRWIIEAYGKEVIKEVLEGRLASEIFPESRRLAHTVFGVHEFKNARELTH